MQSQFDDPIIGKINAILQKHNYYINLHLQEFINSTLAAIENAAASIQLQRDHIHQVQHAFLDRLALIPIQKAYTCKMIKRIENGSLEVDVNGLLDFIHKHIPSIKDMNGFISEVLGINDQKREILSQLGKIRSAVNEYKGNNKSAIVKYFDEKMTDLLLSIKDKSYFDTLVIVKPAISAMMQELQRRETDYYTQFRFFAASRRANSSLQLRINQANDYFQQLNLDNVFSVKASPSRL